jgi:hypothetical protein
MASLKGILFSGSPSPEKSLTILKAHRTQGLKSLLDAPGQHRSITLTASRIASAQCCSITVAAALACCMVLRVLRLNIIAAASGGSLLVIFIGGALIAVENPHHISKLYECSLALNLHDISRGSHESCTSDVDPPAQRFDGAEQRFQRGLQLRIRAAWPSVLD